MRKGSGCPGKELGSEGGAHSDSTGVLTGRGDVDADVPTGGRSCADEGRGRGDASLSQGAAKVASNSPAAGREARSRRSEGAHPADTLGLDSGLQNREMLKFYCCRPLSF